MRTKSFTLIELLVVIVIIGILAGVITLSVSSNISKAQDLKVSSTILSISKTLKADSYDSFPIEVAACNLKNSCTTLKARIDLPNITEDIYYKSSSSGEFFVIYGNKPSNTLLGFEITSIDENVKEVPSFDNLVVYYPLAAGTLNGTAVSDMSPNSNNGTNNGASSATGADGNIGTAMSFDGVNDSASLEHSAILNVTNEITVSIWIYPKNNAGYQVGRHVGVLNKTNILLRSTDNGNLSFNFFLKIGGAYEPRVNYFYGEISKWYHLLITYDNDGSENNLKMYVDGEMKSQSTRIGAIDANTGPILLGVYGPPFYGSMSDIQIYNRALSQSEVTLLYNNK